ncbi:hypothetical protein [Ancylobacter amanitiformis]|uniref:Uncharacterized protein n=1 Tax=Ancylobacter amanitiformis TaxID=217069 RepID=A0ABU0LTS0_9HYPH|nr:hypothetical protein [Ancylobacter amanitiformis]MDQ0512088.1 hypothetical protein [Ancylobacter amanitiformis]
MGMAVPVEKQDDRVASPRQERPLQPERLEAILAMVLDRRQERSERRLQTLVSGDGVNAVPGLGLK